MSKPSGLIVFESADEVQIKIDKSTPVLSATGFYCSLQSYDLCLTSGVEDGVRSGFDAPLAYVQSGGAENGRKQVWFRTRDAANILISRIDEACAQEKLEQRLSLRTPYQESFQTKIQSFIGTCVTAIFVCFLGAGAANVGWKTFDPLASSLAGAHQSADQDQAKLAVDAYNKSIVRDSEASMKRMLDEIAFQEEKIDAYQRSRIQANAAQEKMNSPIQEYQARFAQQAREPFASKIKEIDQGLKLLPERETRDQ